MPISHALFGSLAGRPVDLYTLTNAAGLIARISTLGGTLTELSTPDRHGRLANIVLGFDSLAPYAAEHPFFGVLVGRYANRIANGTFKLDGRIYTLPKNNGRNTLHGGPHGFDKKIWHATPLAEPDGAALRLDLASPDGDMGFPGAVNASVIYRLTQDNHLVIEYAATANAPTHVNLTNHSYFNLRGAGNGTILGHILHLNADAYTPVNDALIPTGEVRPVANSPFDFRNAAPIGSRIAQLKDANNAGGYDHNFVLNGDLSDMKRCAIVSDPHSGRAIEIHTTHPGVQLYTGNFLDGSIAGRGGTYPQHAGFCLETQHFPDSPNQPDFPSTLLLPTETYRQRTTFKFLAV